MGYDDEMRKLVLCVALLLGHVLPAGADCGEASVASPVPTPAFQVAPTATAMFRLREASGEYLAGRAKGAHAGVDLVATKLSADKSLFRIMASGGGVIAFARNSDPRGYGYTIIIDHQNGEYSLYAHLAEQSSKSCVKVGDPVQAGQVIGFVYDPATGEMSSGNAAAKTGVRPWEHIQVHVELIKAPEKGRSSTTTSAPIKTDATIEDPTPRLQAVGYSK